MTNQTNQCSVELKCVDGNTELARFFGKDCMTEARFYIHEESKDFASSLGAHSFKEYEFYYERYLESLAIVCHN